MLRRAALERWRAVAFERRHKLKCYKNWHEKHLVGVYFRVLKQWHLFHALEISAIRLAGLKALGHHCRFFKNSFERRFFSRFFSKGAARRNTNSIPSQHIAHGHHNPLGPDLL